MMAMRKLTSGYQNGRLANDFNTVELFAELKTKISDHSPDLWKLQKIPQLMI